MYIDLSVGFPKYVGKSKFTFGDDFDIISLDYMKQKKHGRFS